MDLLRLVATGMIIGHHLLCQGGLAALFSPLAPTDMLFHALNILCYCAVNLYGLISGYVGAGSRFRLSRLLLLWLQVVFTGLIVTAGFSLFAPNPPSLRDWLAALFPISFDSYWYFTAYFLMSLFLPVLNQALHHITRRQHLLSLWAAFAAFCLLPLFTGRDPFQKHYGYQAQRLMVLYATGDYFRRYGFGWVGRNAAYLYAGSMALAILGRLLLETLTQRYQFTLLPVTLLEKYTSPTLFLGSVALLALFDRLRITGRPARIIAALSPMAFGVYLIHGQPLIYNQLLLLCFVPLAHLSAPALLLIFFAALLAIYALCLLLDWLRLHLFGALRLLPLLEKLENRLTRWLDRLLPP